MKQYTIVGGVNGVGKSSLSGVLRHQLPDMGVIIDPDSIAVQEHCDRLTAGKLAISKVNDCLKKGINFSQETTLSGRANPANHPASQRKRLPYPPVLCRGQFGRRKPAPD